MTKILSIVPYKFLPPQNGGHWGVIIVEKILSVFNEVHTVTTDNNEVKKTYKFKVHPVFSSSKKRYLPYSQYGSLMKVAQEMKPDYIFSHHHYMFPMVAKAAAALKLPWYIRCHNIESERFRSTGKWWWRIMYYFEKRSFLKSDGIFFVTKEDRDWAVKHYGLPQKKAIVMPFGIDFKQTPSLPAADKKALSAQLGLNPGIPWFFFMGQLDYGPNEQAVKAIVQEILPLLRKQLPAFHILICGKQLAATLQQEISSVALNKDICYLGFVPEIEPLIASCDVMLNPVTAGGGVKTKVVESLAWNCDVVSAFSGAAGIETDVCGEKLTVVPDADWQQFALMVKKISERPRQNIPADFFNYYYSENIAERLQQYFSGRSLPDM